MSNEEIAMTEQPAESPFGQTNTEIEILNYKEDLNYSLRCDSFCCSRTGVRKILCLR